MEKSWKSHGKVMEFDGTNCLGTLHEKHDVIIGVCFLFDQLCDYFHEHNYGYTFS